MNTMTHDILQILPYKFFSPFTSVTTDCEYKYKLYVRIQMLLNKCSVWIYVKMAFYNTNVTLQIFTLQIFSPGLNQQPHVMKYKWYVRVYYITNILYEYK